MIWSRKQAGRMLFFPNLTFYWGVQGGLSLPDLWKWNRIWNGEKIPYSLNLLLALDKEIQVPAIEKMLFFVSFHFLFCFHSTYFPLKHYHNPSTVVHEYLLATDIFLFASSQSSRKETGTGIKAESFSLVTQEALVDQSQLPKCCLAIPSLKVSSVNRDI